MTPIEPDNSTSMITAMTALSRDPLRARVKVGRQVVATLTWQQIAALGLEVGRAWDDALATRAAQAAAEDAAYVKAMKVLNRRAVSRRELTRKLAEAGHPPAAIEQAADRLEHAGVLDDRAYGQAVLRELCRGKAAGPRLMRAKLMQKGLAGPLIDELIREADAGRDAVDEARTLAQKKLRAASMQRLDPPARKRRLWGLLARRGFESDVIEAALRGLAGLAGEESDD
jgi:regulatory protein